MARAKGTARVAPTNAIGLRNRRVLRSKPVPVAPRGQRSVRAPSKPTPKLPVQPTPRVLRSNATKANAIAQAQGNGLPSTPLDQTTSTPQDSNAFPIASRTRRRRARQDPWLPKRKPKAPRKPRAPPRTHYTCRICIEEQPVTSFIQYISPRSWRLRTVEVPHYCLTHLAPNPWKGVDPVCKTCIGNNMAAKLDTLGARKVSIGCLEVGCDVQWDWNFILQYFPPGESLEKYSSEMLRIWMEDSKIVTCINTSCGAQGLPDPRAPGYPQVQCHTCSTRMCVACNIPWHTDVTCAEYAARHINEKMSDPEKDTLKLMQSKDGKRCPNCYLVIEKDGGCDSMYCMGCRTYFDWQTAASAVPGSKKAVPVPNNAYWNPSGTPVVCEADALEKQGKDSTTVQDPAVLATAAGLAPTQDEYEML